MEHTMAGEVKVLPNQTQAVGYGNEFSYSAYKQVRVAAVLKNSADEGLYGGSGCLAPYILTSALNMVFTFALPTL